MNPFHCRLRPLHFHQHEDSFANEIPQKCGPTPLRDRMASHCSPSMGATAAAAVTAHKPAHLRAPTQSQILFNSGIISLNVSPR